MKWSISNGRGTCLLGMACFAAMTAETRGIVIEIDYSLDTNKFFNQPGSKDAMRAVCDYYESILTDSLARIDPAEWTGETWTATIFHPSTDGQATFPGKVVPADTIIIYVGARDIGSPLGFGGPGGYSSGGTGGDAQAWFDLLKSRGQPGALITPLPTDFASWGGSIAFNSKTKWNFSLTEAGADASFVSTALHELGHLFGIGTADSWGTYITEEGFTGPASVASYGGNVPLQSGGGHWQDDGVCVAGTGFEPGNPRNVLSKTVAQFGVPAGRDQIARMDPSGCQVGSFHLVMTELDEAGLADVGWEIASMPPVEIVIPEILAAVNPTNGHATLSWFANPALTYQVEEAQGLAGWADLGDPISGQTGAYEFIDSDPPLGRNFYRLEITATQPPSAAAPAFMAFEGERTVEVLPRFAKGCKGCSHGH